MSEDKNGKAKITIEVEVNEALMAAAKEWRPGMGWMHPPWGGMGHWKAQGMMGGNMAPWSMGSGMQCPSCGEPMMKQSKEQVAEMLERKKKGLETALEHINMEIEKLKETKAEEKP